MSKFDRKKVMPRYLAIAVILTMVGFAVVVKAGVIMTAKKDYWEKVAKRQKRDSIPLPAARGNILSCDGQLMASTLPEYKIYFDFQSVDPLDTALTRKMNKVWREQMDSLCIGLNKIFPEKSAEEFKKHLQKGRSFVVYDKKRKVNTIGHRNWPIICIMTTGKDSLGRQKTFMVPKRIDYNTFCKVKELPIINMGRFKSGFHYEKQNSRSHPFGSLAERTVGDLYHGKDSAKNGLELSFDSILRGETGIKRYQKVLNNNVSRIIAPAVDGADIVTTIDVNMQDVVERALVDELKEINGEMGVAILMEVKTGDVKAIANMERTPNGGYKERVNRAVSFRCEPGSVFKVASMLVALDDGVVDTSYVIHTGCGIAEMHGRQMKDHNWRRGGYQDINVARTLEVSSNIGVSHVIDKFYGSNPTKYVEGLYRIGINEDLKLPLVGYQPPYIRMPDRKTTDRTKYWSKTTLAWMSIGYETQIAPINTLTLYNAIANDGKMMRPRFVKAQVRNGEVKEYAPEVIKEQIAKPQTIKTMQTILEHVVSQGLGKKAGQGLSFKVAGKTGTAQVADEHGGYHSGTTRYWLSFAGYFPADKPRYSCIVCLKKTGLPASGGGMSGVVFNHIAQGVMAKNLKMKVDDAHDSTSVMIPDVKNGDLMAADYVLSQLGIKANDNWTGADVQRAQQGDGYLWGKATREPAEVQLSRQKTEENIMPDVTGMGARDAVFLLENLGIKVQISGTGRVKSQSIPYGRKLSQGMTCELQLL